MRAQADKATYPANLRNIEQQGSVACFLLKFISSQRPRGRLVLVAKMKSERDCVVEALFLSQPSSW